MVDAETQINDESMAAPAPGGGLALVRHEPSPRLRGVAHDYWGYTEQTAGPLRRRELPSADIIFIVNLGAPLLVVQVACTLVLVVAAGLFMRTFGKLATLDIGLDREAVLVVDVDAARSRAPEGARLALHEVLNERHHVPRVHLARVIRNG